MLSKEDNELITRCGPGTPMGELLRQYWIPAVRSDELPEADCPPIRIRLLHEDLVAFRASSGNVGIVDDACPHRGASMFYGRNEEEGLRCVYHGWKFDVSGQCVEMMNEPPTSAFPEKVKIRAYRTQERGGIVWAYMGPRENPPPLPNLIPMQDGSGLPNVVLNQYNWLQAMENNMDTAHNPILHFGAVPPELAEAVAAESYFGMTLDLTCMVENRAPVFEIREAEYGLTYGCSRPGPTEGTTYWRTMNWLWPFYTMTPTWEFGTRASVVITVPVDEYHNMQWSMSIPLTENAVNLAGAGRRQRVPNTTHPLGRFRNPLDPDTDFGIDRSIQRAKPPTLEGFTGLKDIGSQDEAMKWSQGRGNGGIVDRSKERLGTTDLMIIQARNRLIAAAKALSESGTTPPAVDTPEAYALLSGWIVIPADVDWYEGTRDLRENWRPNADQKIAPMTQIGT